MTSGLMPTAPSGIGMIVWQRSKAKNVNRGCAFSFNETRIQIIALALCLTLLIKNANITTKQVIEALDALLANPLIPNSESDNAKQAHAEASSFARGIPPYGWDAGPNGRSQSYPFDKNRTYSGFRFDIENKVGNNLTQ